MAAYVLTQAGAKVVMLEAGPIWDSGANGDMIKRNYTSLRRGAAIPEKAFGEFDGCIGSWTFDGEPYTHTEGTQWDWYRTRMLGGKTNHWGRISLRFGPDDFRGYSRDGLGDDWPITYDDVAPDYNNVDRIVGIFGSKDGFYNEPDGIFMPPPAPRVHELLVMKGADKIGIPVLANRLSIITKPLNGRPTCHYCAQCGRGCSTHSNFSSTSVLLPPARQTGNLEIIPHAMVREVLTDEEGLATGVSYVSKDDMQDYKVRARVVVVAASRRSARMVAVRRHRSSPQGGRRAGGRILQAGFLHQARVRDGPDAFRSHTSGR